MNISARIVGSCPTSLNKNKTDKITYEEIC